MKSYDVTALGELLIDFTPHGLSGQGNQLFEANPGGAPCNVLAMLAKLGKKTGFIGKVGDDIFGTLLRDTIRQAGIDDRGLVNTSKERTTLAFVNIDHTGDRSFSFYRNPGADMKLTSAEVDCDLIKKSRIFHFGTLSMTHETPRLATKTAIAKAEASGCILSFDPNLRPLLWEDMETAREQMLYGCAHCQILKIEDEELMFMTGMNTVEDGIRCLNETFRIPLVLVTAGAKGSTAYYGQTIVSMPAFLTDRTIDTTGAGDTFCGCCLAHVLDYGLEALDREKLTKMLRFASAAASIITTRKGAIKSMPEISEIEEFT